MPGIETAAPLRTETSNGFVFPGGNFTFGTEILDQSGKTMPGEVSVKLISPTGEEKVYSVSSGEFKSVDFICRIST